MRKRCPFLILSILIALACLPLAAAAGEFLYQYSTINALLAGLYDGQLTMKDLKSKGSLGLGTFNHLDGEMVVLDGQVYQVKADGKVAVAADPVKTPFAVVTFFTPKQFILVKKAGSIKELGELLDAALATRNLFYAVKIEGRFQKVTARSVPRQTRPYPPLVKAAEHEAVFPFDNVVGTIVGLRCPGYVQGINVPGYHFHFLTRDRKAGGHVLDCAVENVTVQVDPSHRLELVLPEDREFYWLDLDRATTQELEKVEK